MRENPENAENCLSCGNQLHINARYWLDEPLRPLNQSPRFEVFKVDDRGTPKVLKLLKSNELSDITRFEQEARILISLRHPGIPRADADAYFSYTLDNGRILHCLVMEEIEGQNLEDWLQENGPISQDLALKWLTELAEILDYVHQWGFFHRDINPSNIICRPNGQLVLIDFGAAKQITDPSVDKQGTAVYSSGYTAGEQLEGRSVPQSDFFALGRTFVHLLTGRHPNSFVYSETGQLIWRQSLQQENIDDLANFIDELMAPSVQDRPQDTEAIQQRIEQFSDELYPPQPPDPPLPKPPFRWYQWAVISGVPVILLVVIGWLFPPPPPLCNSSALDVSEMAFSRNGRYLITASLDNTIRVSNAASNNKQVDCRLLRDGVVALKFSPLDSTKKGAEEGTVAMVKLDGSVDLWDVDTEGNIERSQSLQVLGRVVALAFSPQGNYLATAAEGGTVQVWDTNTYEEIKLRPYGSYVKAVSFSQDEKYLAIVGLDKRADVWEWRTTDKLTPLPDVVAVAFSPEDSKYLATGDVKGNVKVRDTSTFKVINEVNLGSYPTAISFSPEGKHLLLLGLNKKAQLWEWEKHNATITLERAPKDKVVAATFSPRDGKYIATASDNGTVRVWNNDGTSSTNLPNSNNSLTAVVFNPKDENQLAVATADGSVQIIKWSATKQ